MHLIESAQSRVTGEVRDFGVDQLFFSTTDRRGVIDHANSVFVELSGYPLIELLGAPHNIIRHPQMPAGAFKIVWSILLAGAPICAYVRNLAADGAEYWVFATIVNVGDRLLSVRTKPCATELFDATKAVYERVRAAELEAARAGSSREQVAAIGEQLINAELQQLGMNSFFDYMLTMMPAETSARAALSDGLPGRALAEGPLGGMLRNARQLGAELQQLVAAIAPVSRLAGHLSEIRDRAQDAAEGLADVVAAAEQGAHSVSDSFPVLLTAARGMSLHATTTSDQLIAAADSVDDLRIRLAEAQFRIGLASVENHIVANFAAELIDEAAPHGAKDSIGLLCRALHEGIAGLSADLETCYRDAAETQTRLMAAHQALNDFQRSAKQWRMLSLRYRLSDLLGEQVTEIDRLTVDVQQTMRNLEEAAQQCEGFAVPFDDQQMAHHVDAVVAAAGQLRGS